MADSLPLINQVIAISGRMISMSHADAADLIGTCGGRFTRSVTSATTVLVIGEDGLPLDADGVPDAKIRRAGAVSEEQGRIEILSESEFLARLDPSHASDRVRRLYSLPELRQITGVPAGVLRSWVRTKLLAPVEERQGLKYFDFGQVSRLRVLSELASRGISSRKIRAGLEELSRWLSDPDPLQLLNAVDSHQRQLVVRLSSGRLAETGGQLLLDFADHDGAQLDVLTLPTAPLLDRAIEYEESGELELAATVYREVLSRGDDTAETRFSLANIEYTLGRLEEAIELFEQALDRNADYPEAWNNLGSALLDTDRLDEAILAFHKAVAARPSYADAHFNLANVLDDHGRADEAREHWMAYLKLSENAKRSSTVRAKRRTARHHAEGADEPHILRFDSLR